MKFARKRAKFTFVEMSKRRIYISVLLMVMAILAIITFQAYWVFKNYQEEKQNLQLQTNFLFREAVYQCQAKKMKLDTAIKFRYSSTDKVRVISALENRLRDTVRTHLRFKTRFRMPDGNQHIGILKDSLMSAGEDSAQSREVFTISPTGEKTVVKLLETAEALQDSITTGEVEDQYRKMLARENIQLPFTITKFQGVRNDEFEPPELENDNEVSIGFLKPVTFRVHVTNTTGYIMRKMSPIILLSFLLVTITVLSFVLLFRNLMRQRKLAQLKNDFISNITHELKTPIATVSVAIEAMKNFDVLQNPERTQEYLNISANELQRLSLLVDKVLRLSMFEKKQIEFKKEPFDLVQLVRDVMESMQLQFEKQEAETSIELFGKNFVIEADKRHLASMIYNLLDNALKYTLSDPAIKVQIHDRSQFIELRVSDNGIGIPQEYKTKVFEQFFRVPSGDKHNTKGYGLGLSYVNHIVRSHMGFIEVESELNKGTTFIIKLPFAEAGVVYYDNNRRVWKENFKL